MGSSRGAAVLWQGSHNRGFCAFAGTTHAILETRGAVHYGVEAAGAAQQQQQAAAGTGTGAAVAAAGGQVQRAATGSDSIHTLCTGNGSPYQNYQLRIAYATYKLVQAMPGGERHVAFTRILHRTKPVRGGVVAGRRTSLLLPPPPAARAVQAPVAASGVFCWQRRDVEEAWWPMQ